MRGTSTIRILLVFWATFALHLAVAVEDQQFEFGDIIAVGRNKGKDGKPLYTHWAVYVGKGHVEGLKDKNDAEDIFHIYRVPNIKMSDCVFGKKGDEEYVKSNYLDKDKTGKGHDFKSREEMIKTINDLHKKCGRWWPRSHNCEHVATSIRYGFQHCEQKGTRLPKFLRKLIVQNPANNAGKRSLMDLLDPDSRLAAAGA